MSELWSLSMFDEALSFAFWVAVSGACICTGVVLAERALGRRSPPLAHAILLTGVLGLMAIPVLVALGQTVAPALELVVDEGAIETVRIPMEHLAEFMRREPEALSQDPGLLSGRSLGSALTAMWLLGVMLGLGRVARALCKRNRAIVAQPWQPPFWTEKMQKALARQLGLKRFPPVHISPMAPMPMVLGVWHPTIILPEQAPDWGQEEWEAVLLHEGAHVARRDPWAVLAQRGATILYWWCPLVYLLNRRLNLLRESICDDYALQGRCDHVHYVELLIESAERLLNVERLPTSIALLDPARGGLEARVTRLLKKERPMTRLSVLGKISAISLTAVCLLATVATVVSAAQPEVQKKVQIKIVVDGKEYDLESLLNEREAATKKESTTTESKTVPAYAIPVQGNNTFNYWVSADAERANAWKVFTQTKSVTQPDPRIDELVKQAEAIKPGSGAAIRKALESRPASGDKKDQSTLGVINKIVTTQPDRFTGAGELVVKTIDGEKVLVIMTDSHQIKAQELKKTLENRASYAASKKEALSTETKKERPGATEAGVKFWRETETKSTPPVTEMEALRRQLERLSAEVKELQQRLDKK